MMVSATTLDTVRIECLGESRAVTCPGRVWVEIRDKHQESMVEIESVLLLMDGLAEQWGDEGVFRRCRDRLRKLVREYRGTTP